MGLYLSNMKANEKLLVSAAVGQGLYATEVNGWDRIGTYMLCSRCLQYFINLEPAYRFCFDTRRYQDIHVFFSCAKCLKVQTAERGEAYKNEL